MEFLYQSFEKSFRDLPTLYNKSKERPLSQVYLGELIISSTTQGGLNLITETKCEQIGCQFHAPFFTLCSLRGLFNRI